MITIVSPDQFIKEVKQWGARENSLHKVRIMEKGDLLFFRFCIPQTSEVLESRINRQEYNNFQFMELAPISIGAIWEEEDEEIKNLIKRLEELNANNTSSNWDYSKGRRLEFS